MLSGGIGKSGAREMPGRGLMAANLELTGRTPAFFVAASRSVARYPRPSR
jgi:hypothetical protein